MPNLSEFDITVTKKKNLKHIIGDQQGNETKAKASGKLRNSQCCHVFPARSSAFFEASPTDFLHLPNTFRTFSTESDRTRQKRQTQFHSRIHKYVLVRMAIRIRIQIQILLLTFEGERGGQRRGLTRVSIRSLIRIRHGARIV